MPDYQGIGLGRKFLNIISKIYIEQGYDFKIVTSAKNLASALIKDNTWQLVRFGKMKEIKQDYNGLKNSSSFKRQTFSFFKKK